MASDAVDTFVFDDTINVSGKPLYLDSWLHRQPIPSTMQEKVSDITEWATRTVLHTRYCLPESCRPSQAG